MNKLALVGAGIGKFVSNNSSKILAGLAIGLGIGTVIFAVKAVPKAQAEAEEELERKNTGARENAEKEGSEEHEYYEKLEPRELVKCTWKCFIPTALMGCATIACIVGANVVSEKRQFALTSAATMTSKAFEEYKQALKEVIPEKKLQEVETKVNDNAVKSNPVTNAMIYDTGLGNNLCYDWVTGRYFLHNYDRINGIESTIDKRLRNEMYLTYGEYSSEFGLPSTGIDDSLVLSIERCGSFEFKKSSHLSENGIPVLVIRPSLDFEGKKSR